MIILIGLGNPGKKFENTRHNVGFMVLDKFAKENNFPDFELQKKCEALVSEGVGGDKKILLAKPQTFMNESGRCAKKIITNYPLPVTNHLIVIHDDIDLPIGKIKIVKERGSAGHKGIESIIKSIGNEGLVRVRIGIKPAFAKASAGETKKIVLKKFSKDEEKILGEAVKKSVEALNSLITQGLEKTMNEYN